MRTIRSVFVAAFLLCGSAAFAAGSGIVSIDHVEGAKAQDTLYAGQNLRFVIKLDNTVTNGPGTKCDVSVGFRITTPDGAVWDSVTMDSTGYPFTTGESPLAAKFPVVYSFLNYYDNSAAGDPDTVGVLWAGQPANATRQLPVGYNDTAMAVLVWASAPAATNSGKHLCIDSSFYQPGGTWSWNYGTTVITTVYPAWEGLAGMTHADGAGYCFTLVSPSAVNERGSDLPNSFSVSQNYPNPFNPTTKIDFDVPTKSQVKLDVYNVLGQKVTTLIDQTMNPGKYQTEWNGRSEGGVSVASGIYFYKFTAGNYVVTKKMIMLK